MGIGILAHLLLWPVTGPLFLVRFSLDKVQAIVRDELTDDERIKAELLELQLAQEVGDIDEAEYLAREAELMERWREMREWREYFGMDVPGGVVRVAPASETDEPAPERDAAAADEAEGQARRDTGKDAIIELILDLD